MRHKLLFIFFIITTMSLISQEKPILLFPEGAPGEKVKMKQVDDLTGNKVAGCPVMRTGSVSEPTLTFYPAPADNNSGDRKSTRLNSSHVRISYAVFCLKKK